MSSINFNNLKKETYSEAGYTFSDVYLDLAQQPFEMVIGNREIRGTGKDIKVAYDLNAIKNSLLNLFNTMPGDRYLLPDYGCDIRKYIFEPMTDSVTNDIGRDIKSSIDKWEPRVKVINIHVVGYRDIHEYDIDLTIEVPFLQRGEKLKVAGLLNKQGFTYGG